MIVEKSFKEEESQVEGTPDERIEMGVDSDSINHLMMILSSNLYQNPIGSIVREYTSNAIDANIEAKIDEPVIVRLTDQFFEVQDFGNGLDDKDFREIISKYGKSTKRDSKDQLGYFGLGCKSGFAYTNSFNYTSIKGGKERKYLLYKSAIGFTIDLLFEKDTTERSGVTVRIPIKSFWDNSKFLEAIKNQLAYFDNVYFDIKGADLNKNYKIFREKDFQWSTLYNTYGNIHITLGRVNYPIDWSQLGLSKTRLPIALKFDLDSGIFPIPNRENLIWNDRTKEAVKQKLKDVSNWFIDKYNSEVKEIESISKAWPYINSFERFVKLGDRSFDAKELEKYTTKLFNEIQIKGVKFNTPESYRAAANELFREYRVVARYDGTKIKTKGTLTTHWSRFAETPKSILLIDDNVKITGYFRDYLKTLDYQYIVRKNTLPSTDLEYYRQQLRLKQFPKTVWRNKIKEWQEVQKSLISDTIVDGINLHTDKPFLDYKEANKRVSARTARVSNPLGKTKADVTVGYCVEKRGGGYKFEKKLEKLGAIHKFLMVYVQEGEEEEVFSYIEPFSKQKVKFAKIGTIDLKKILKLKHYNIMTLNELKKRKTFARVATAIKAFRAVKEYEELIYDQKLELVHEALKRVADDYKFVSEYSSKNYDIEDTPIEVEDGILQVAKDNNIWDMEVFHIVDRFSKYVKDFEFIILINDRNLGEEAFKSLVYNLILFKKLKFEEKFSNLEICIRNEKPLEEGDLITQQMENLLTI